MYKLIIVDDEQIVIDAVKYIIEKNMKEVAVSATAKSGREAIEKAKSVHPDIMLMDIRMPGINGLDAIREIKLMNPDTRFIIISAYEQFEFAKKAMTLGVEDYILKPINRTNLIHTIEKVTKEIEMQKEKKKRELETIEKLEKVIPYLEQGFIYSILLNTEFSDEAIKFLNLLGFENAGGYMMILQFGEGEEVGRLSNKIGSSIIGHKIYPYVRDIIKYKCKCIVGPVMINKIVVYISSTAFTNEYEYRLQAIELAEEIINSVKTKTQVEFFVGIGGFKDNQEIIYSYNEAEKALRNNSGEKISHILDICNIQPQYTQNPKDIDKLIARIEMGDEEGATAIVKSFTDKIKADASLNAEHKKNMILEMMVMAHRKALEANIREDSYLKYGDYISEMLSRPDYDSLTSWCINRTAYITKKLGELKAEKGNSIVEKAKNYMEEYYNKEITLEDISKKVNISPQYFSKLFKEETGYNFIEYLTFIRIEKAKNLMHSTDMSIKEICYEVGYGDPNYFSRLFKKNTGISPTTYIHMER
ncbi:MAG: response regulator [Firmicutes bacterium]|nr:response regulator [Bacillota bacterium]